MKFSTTDRLSKDAHCQYQIEPDHNLRIEEYEGRVGLKELKAVIRAMGSDPYWSAELNGLVDFSRAELDLSVNDVLRLALLMRQEDYRSHGWLAFAVGNSAAFGMIRMLGYWTRSTDRTRIFQTREEAEGWIRRRANHLPPAAALARPDLTTPARHAGELRMVS